jgi:hypothetical protein
LFDKAVFGLCELLALLFGLPFGEDLYNDRPIAAWHYFYLAVAVLLAIGGPMWPWIKTRSWISESLSSSVSQAARDARLWVVLLLVLFVYVTGRDVYPRTAASAPSAADIAQAVVDKLPKGNPTSSPVAPVSPAEPYVNPLRDKITKWQIAHGLREGILKGQISPNCKVVIVRLQETYAEDYAADLKEILDVAGLKYEEHFATSSINKGLTIRASNSPSISRECGEALSGMTRTHGRTPKGIGVNADFEWLTEKDVQGYLKQSACSSDCIEVDFGNEETFN